MQTRETSVEEETEPAAEPVKHRTLLQTLKNVTPARLGFLLFFVTVFSSIFCIIAVSTIQQHETAVKIVGKDSAPSVIAAYEIKSGVLAMDRDLANQLLFKADEPEGQDMADDSEKWRIIVCKELVAAAKNITFPGELEPIENIQIALGKYAKQAEHARNLHQNGRNEQMLKAYRESLQTIQTELLPNIAVLEKIDEFELENTYNREKSASNLSRGFLLVLGLALAFSLLYTQYFLSSRFHRRFCPPILLSMFCLIALLHQLTNSLTANSNYLRIAKEDSYDSVLSLLITRASAFDAAACASRRLLDPENASAYQKEYEENLASIARFDGSHNIEETIKTAQRQLQKNEKFNLQGFTGSLATEINNAGFEEQGEPSLAIDTLAAFSDYCQAEWKVKELDESGSHDEAVRMCLSYNPSGSKYPFMQFDDALVRTLKINQEQMNINLKGAFKSLEYCSLATELISLLIVICVYAGLTPRMDEYFKVRSIKS